jgi:hypothetical protein
MSSGAAACPSRRRVEDGGPGPARICRLGGGDPWRCNGLREGERGEEKRGQARWNVKDAGWSWTGWNETIRILDVSGSGRRVSRAAGRRYIT